MANPNYEELIALGMPRLPKGFSYKFSFRSWTRMKPGFTTIVDKKIKDALYCSLRKHFLGIPFRVAGSYIDADDLGHVFSQDIHRALMRHFITAEEQNSPTWLPGHFAYTGHEAWNLYNKELAEKEQKKAAEEARKLATQKKSADVKHLINRRMP